MNDERAQTLRLEAWKKLSLEDRIKVLGSLMDVIAELKIQFFMEATGYDREKAIEVLRKRLIELQEMNR